MQLIIDIGNTRTKIVLFEKGQIVSRYYPKSFNIKWLEDLKSKQPFDSAILSSVNHDNHGVENWLAQSCFFIKLTHTTAIPIKNNYKTPQTLGKDRLAAAVGAFALYPQKNCLVVDAGTCMTYEWLSEAGIYKGGNIAPGIEMRFRAMHEFTAKLPLVGKQRLSDWIGFNTETALQMGGQMGAVLEIEGFVARYEREYGSIQLILTGGDAATIAEHLDIENFIINEDIVLIGLYKILKYNANLLESTD
ncbi:MAG: type III pantothenate kinase [Saprospiraceae bacterium]